MPLRRYRAVHRILPTAGFLVFAALPATAQAPPTEQEIAVYTGLLAAAASGSTTEVERQVKAGADIDARDASGRTPLMIAAYRRDVPVARALIEAGANVNALENRSYDVVTIAAVLNDLDMLQLAILSGGNPRAITSPYGGTALIAAAHLGHVEIVQALIAAGAPLDHINNLGMTALIEAIVLGDGGPRHQATVGALVRGGANANLADAHGTAPLALARQRGLANIVRTLEQAGAKP